MQKGAAFAMIVTYNAASLIATAAGVLVALAAAPASNHLVSLRDSLGLIGRSRESNFDAPTRLFPKYPLRRQFSKIPAFALLAWPVLAIALSAFMSFSAFHVPVGLELRMIEREPRHKDTLRPIVIRISGKAATTDRRFG